MNTKSDDKYHEYVETVDSFKNLELSEVVCCKKRLEE